MQLFQISDAVAKGAVCNGQFTTHPVLPFIVRVCVECRWFTVRLLCAWCQSLQMGNLLVEPAFQHCVVVKVLHFMGGAWCESVASCAARFASSPRKIVFLIGYSLLILALYPAPFTIRFHSRTASCLWRYHLKIVKINLFFSLLIGLAPIDCSICSYQLNL
jgi:hypothetical protein